MSDRAKINAGRFWPKVDKRGPDDCWPWLGSHHVRGYGHYFNAGRCVMAHRAAYELLVGAVPTGLHLDHLCRNPNCVNPRHLEPVTSAVNVRRGLALKIVDPEIRAAFIAGTSCFYGHVHTPENSRALKGKKEIRCLVCHADRQWAREK